MPTQPYRTKDGKRVPGVTTILSRFKESGALLHWAWEQGRDGKDFRETRDAAADAGTCCHEMIEADWHHTAFDRSKYQEESLKKADHAFLSYLEWKQQTGLTIEKSELSLVSEAYRFGGTMDAVIVGNHLCLGDYKTSNGVYADYLLQVAGGYSILWHEHFPTKPLHGIHILRFSKPKQDDDPISFHHHFWSAEIFAPCHQQFVRLREAYEADKRIQQLL